MSKLMTPELNVTRFANEDVIATSTFTMGRRNGNYYFGGSAIPSSNVATDMNYYQGNYGVTYDNTRIYDGYGYKTVDQYFDDMNTTNDLTFRSPRGTTSVEEDGQNHDYYVYYPTGGQQ